MKIQLKKHKRAFRLKFSVIIINFFRFVSLYRHTWWAGIRLLLYNKSEA